MKWVRHWPVAVLFTALLIPIQVSAQADVAKLRQQFDGIIQGLNDNSFERFNRSISKKDMTARIFGATVIESDVKKAFTADFET